MTRLFIVLISVLGVVFSGQGLAKPTPDNTLSISAAFEFTSLDPSKNGYIFSRMQIIETLLDVDENGELIPALASHWSISNDAKTWTFDIRQDVHFHDGSLLDAVAVVNSLYIALQKHGALRKAPIEQIEALGKHKVVIRLSSPYVVLGAVLANYANAILSPSAYAKDGGVLALSSTGPYQLYQFSPPHKLVVEKFDDYWGKKASIPYASYLTGHRAESRVLQARSGQADIVFGLDPATLPILKRLPNLTLHSNAIPRTIVIKLNSEYPFLKDIRARQALSDAINRVGIARGVLRTPGAETEQIMPASMSNWHLDVPNKGSDGKAKAEALLAELGWQKNANGYLEKQGDIFTIRLITYADRPELTTVATAIQAQWEAIGVKTKVDVTNSSAIPMGHQDGSLQAALIARNYGFMADPLAVLLADYGKHGGGDWGAMNWHNDAVSTLLSELEQTTDAQTYRQKAQQVAQLIYNERPVIPVTSYVQQTSVSKRVKGFRFDPFERHFLLNEMEFIR
ncbi:ABC transporter substrate-binding protein [Marinomonas posidonica]|uniref:ABC-type transporter, periplasmic subunit n=1 Tax=Marinomonas posidonica (strain CECT 7376 / NCIMB 14433 / IVIA-Po-181) TaxID=491952 RepID=F6CRV6_MARPP|nr:ABC transporter substrate-binding protein [Marinomonas posidonica]AEF54959.1 ABC-type transporter, periplasmic subunit [Marinomonas posidonica IVIA-Po-181]